MARRWKLLLLALALLALLLGGYVLYLFVIAGQFKSIEPHFAGTCRAIPGVVGPEDITIDPRRGYAYLSSDDRRATLAGRPVPGAIYGYDLTDPQAVPVNLTPDADETFHPHGIGLYRSPDGGRALLYVVNHPGASLFGPNPGAGPPHTIEVFEHLDGLQHRYRLESPLLVSPNDVAPVADGRFYVTNDHGSAGPGLERTLEEYLRLRRATVLYYDGSRFAQVADDLRYANGIAVSPDGARVYVAQVTDFALAVYDRDPATGALTLAGDIALGTGPDNIEVDPIGGGLWIGAHPKLFDFVAYSRDAEERSPSQVLHVLPDGPPEARVREIYLDDGTQLSGSSVAAFHDGRLLVGSVFDPHFLDCRLE